VHPAAAPAPAEQNWRAAAAADRQTATTQASWKVIEGLGPSGKAVALQTTNPLASWSEADATAPTLEYDFQCPAGDATAWLDFLPMFRLYPGMKLRVAVSVDDGQPTIIEVPGSSGTENENGQVRSQGVQNNYVRAQAPLPALPAGRHTFKLRALDPGVVLDRVWLP